MSQAYAALPFRLRLFAPVVLAASVGLMDLPSAVAQPPRPKAQPGAKGKASPKKKDAPASKGSAAPAPLEIDPDKLPEGYAPPPPPPEVMSIDKPLVTDEQLKVLKRDDGKFKTAINKSEWQSAATQTLLRNGIEYRLAQLTLPDNRANLVAIRDEMLRQIDTMGKVGIDKPDQIREARRFLLGEVVRQSEQLLDNNFYVRLHVVYVLSELNLTDEDARRGLKQEAFIPALGPLLTVLGDAKQPEAVKIMAVRGVARILKFSSPDVKTKQNVASVLVSELGNDKSHPWYQRRLAYAMSVLDIAVDLNRKPVLVDALVQVVNDSKRDWQTRAEAARSLGRVPYDPSVDTKVVVDSLVNLAAQAGKSAQEAWKSPVWTPVFAKLYLAYREEDANDMDAERKGKGGLLNRQQFAQSNLRPSYQHVVGIFNALLNGAQAPAADIAGLELLQKQTMTRPNGGANVAEQ